MKTINRFAVAIATLFACAAVMIVFTPKRTEGTVAAAVQVVNPSLPVDLENSAVRTPFQVELRVYGNTVLNGHSAFGSPGEQERLVIEYVSANCTSGDTNFYNFRVSTPNPDGTYVDHYFTPTFLGYDNNFNIYRYGIAQYTHLYASPGADILVSADYANCDVSVSGYLVYH
jgi:hypothetical protein